MSCVTRKAAGSSGKKGVVGENQSGGFRTLPSISHVRVAKALAGGAQSQSHLAATNLSQTPPAYTDASLEFIQVFIRSQKLA